jgi:stage V sporulation protein AE
VKEAVLSDGLLGALTGGITASAGGITAAMFFGLLSAVIFRSKSKS